MISFQMLHHRRFQEEWNHSGESERSDGIIGFLSEMRKRLTVNATGEHVHFRSTGLCSALTYLVISRCLH